MNYPKNKISLNLANEFLNSVLQMEFERKGKLAMRMDVITNNTLVGWSISVPLIKKKIRYYF